MLSATCHKHMPSAISLPLWRRNLALPCGAILLAGVLSVGFFHVPILRGISSFLIVEDSLRPAAAIVALGGQTPFREMEAAKFYRSGLATQVFIVREAPNAEADALQELGIKKPQSWELARAVLMQQGVPPEAIVTPKDEAVGTLEELQAVYKALTSQRSDISDQRSEVGDQRSDVSDQKPALSKVEGSAGMPVASQRSEVGDQKSEIRGQKPAVMPVILVTSKYHTRRTRLTWHYVSGGRSQAIVRAASGDPFDPERWWHTRRYALAVVREYLGLINYYAGFVIGP